MVVGHDVHVCPGGQGREHLFADDGEVTADVRHRGFESVDLGQLFGPGVADVEVEVVAGEDAGEFESDVADAEDRHRGGHGQRFEEDGDLSPAALAAVLRRCLSLSRRVSISGSACEPAPSSVSISRAG